MTKIITPATEDLSHLSTDTLALVNSLNVQIAAKKELLLKVSNERHDLENRLEDANHAENKLEDDLNILQKAIQVLKKP